MCESVSLTLGSSEFIRLYLLSMGDLKAAAIGLYPVWMMAAPWLSPLPVLHHPCPLTVPRDPETEALRADLHTSGWEGCLGIQVRVP